MDIWIIIKANIRHQKGSFFSVLILMMLVSMALTAVITVDANSARREEEAMEEAGFGDMLVCISGADVPDMKKLIQKTKECEAVETVKEYPAVFSGNKGAKVNGRETDSLILQAYDPEKLGYQIYQEEGAEFQEQPEKLNPGEIYVPSCYQSSYGCETGDVVSIKTGNGKKTYVIKNFMEDPMMGSSLMGIKTLLFSQEDLEELTRLAERPGEQNLQGGSMLSVFQKDSSPLSYMRFEQKLNQDTGITGYAQFALGKNQAMEYMLTLTNIFSGIFISFIVLLLVITLIVMSHSISTGIEMEYVNLGILKAVGFCQSRLKIQIILQYMLGILIGILLGMGLSIPTIKCVNQMLLPVISLKVSDRIAAVPCLAALGGILLFLAGFICLKLQRMRRITPVRAISGGRDSIYFSSRLELPIRRRGMDFWLAFRQLTSNGKQYVSAGLIAALLVFFLVMVSHMAGDWMGENGEAFQQLFQVGESDLEVRYVDRGVKEEAEKIIEAKAGIEDSYEIQGIQLMIEGCQIYCYIASGPKAYGSILEGRTCQYDNEVLITKYVAKDLELEIGDTVTVAKGEEKAEYLVSGIYQCANDMGMNFAMNKEGYERLGTLNGQDGYWEYILEDKEQKDQLTRELNEIYGKRIAAGNPGGINDLQMIVDAIEGCTALIYGFSVIFAAVVIFTVCGKIFAKEQQDYGIYKSMGFTSGKLRLQFALRFGMVAVLGSTLGILCSLGLMKKAMGVMLSFVGVSEVEVKPEFWATVLPLVFLTLVFFGFSYLVTRKIKKVQLRILVTE